VTAASVQDPAGARLLLARLDGAGKKLRRIWVDGGYRGQLLDWVAQRFHFRLQVVLRPPERKGFTLLPRRGVVERTFAWFSHHRRLSKDYEGQSRPAKP
jgi:putative transposase